MKAATTKVEPDEDDGDADTEDSGALLLFEKNLESPRCLPSLCLFLGYPQRAPARSPRHERPPRSPQLM
jgi:hypothetical protein